MRVYLTGGSGLLGSHVALRLRARGDEVVCLQRRGSATDVLERAGCEIVTGDVRTDPKTLTTAIAGCDAVVHGAALIYAGVPWPEVTAVNVGGTTTVVRAATMAGVPHVVHISSVAAYGRRPGPIDESTPLDAPVDPGNLYARSKRESERAAEAAVGPSTRLTILRPAALYGERDRLFTPKLLHLARMPLIPLLGRGDNTLPVVYAGNAAQAVESALHHGSVHGVFNVSMDYPLTQSALLGGFARAVGRRERFLRVPAGLVMSMCRLGDAIGFTIPGARDLSPSQAASLALADNSYRSEWIRERVGWVPELAHEEAIRRTGAWFLARSG